MTFELDDADTIPQIDFVTLDINVMMRVIGIDGKLFTTYPTTIGDVAIIEDYLKKLFGSIQ